MERAPECPKCSRTMESGFVLDITHGAIVQSSWVEGAPIKSVWTGLKLKGRQRLPVTTYRCKKCGFLESYASLA
jgi:hypothetical protein